MAGAAVEALVEVVAAVEVAVVVAVDDRRRHPDIFGRPSISFPNGVEKS